MCICWENKIQYKNFHPSTIDYTPSIHVWYIYLYIYHKSQPFMLVNIPFVPWIRHGYNPTVQVHRGIGGSFHVSFGLQTWPHWEKARPVIVVLKDRFLTWIDQNFLNFWALKFQNFDLDFSKASHFWGPGGIRPKKVAKNLNFEAREKSEAKGIRFQMLSKKCSKTSYVFCKVGGQVIKQKQPPAFLCPESQKTPDVIDQMQKTCPGFL